jgi:outer membrane scaffolding protein for murein synthesis (MipA/OmpV family)
MHARRDPRRRGAALCTLALGATHAAGAFATPQPLWEFGLGIGALVFNDYRGASGVHGYPLPVPYFIYRGDILRADRDGVRGRFLNQRYVEFDLSANATAPVFSRASGPRSGMPNLASTLEFGPSLQAHLWRADDGRLRLDLRTPVRNAVTLASPPRSIGWLFEPNLSADWRPGGVAAGWNLGLLGGPLYAQRRYHEYFYSVAPQYATATRPEYQAPGGYSGSQLLLAVSKRYPHYWVGAYLRHDWLQGTVFIDSPLVQQRSYWSGGVAIVWMISASARMVDSAGDSVGDSDE